ncbi:PREDICTED: putative fidgetin-like protein 2 [Dipodomys ordii]|uniref:Fidgetin-like protein 2 n=1 Tax=Dipodomys ordii TaxID=10020 RepID=A0A1S3FC02_DIPOR|nr:PREDICTED: putative fidgetin-like protein 2 [Dipodomys ordii]
MHWTPEHAQPLNQWPEQHLDVSSTTPSPAHKLELPPGGRQRCHYAWAHDDISALTASNLLKRYAEKYSGVLDSPYERPSLGGYGDAAFLNGAKGDPEPWPGPEPPYPLASLHEGLPGAKPGAGGGSAGLGGSPIVAGNLSDTLYAGNACGGPSAAPEYTPGYGGGYLAPGYCTQTGAALAPPSPPPPPPPPPGSGAPALLYNYTEGGYGAHPGYGALPPPPAAPPGPYLPSGLAAPTPLPAPAPPRPAPYGFPSAADPGASLKRKATDEGSEDRYRKYAYEPPKAHAADGAPYPAADNNGECRGNGFRAKPPGAADEASAKFRGSVPLKVLGSPAYGPPLEPFEKFPERVPAPTPRGGFAMPSGEPPKGVDPGALELVTSKMVEGGPPVQWADVAGQGALKAALEEELVWPLLRPPAYPGSPRPPRTVLFFGPRALVQGTQGFSGGELGQLCQQAAAGAGLPGLQRPLAYKDLEAALAKVGPRATPKELDSFVEWDKMYGSGH